MPIKGNQRQLGALFLPSLNGSVFWMPLSCTCTNPALLNRSGRGSQRLNRFHCLHFWSEADWEKWVLSKRSGSPVSVSIPACSVAPDQDTAGTDFYTSSSQGVVLLASSWKEEGCTAEQKLASLVFMRLFIFSITSVGCPMYVEWEFNTVIK